MKKVLVFDLGVTSGCALLCGYENNMFCSTEIYSFGYSIVKRDGKPCVETASVFREIQKGLEKASDYEYDAVSVDVWGMDFALLDENGELLTNYLCISEGDNNQNNISRETGSKAELYKRTGVLCSGGIVSRLHSLQSNSPRLLEKSARLLMTPDLINYFLTGEMKNEYTAAVTTGLINPEKRAWDEELIRKLGLSRSLFGNIIQAGEIYGYLKADFTDRTIPVFAAPGHDAACTVIAAPCAEREFAFICCGTTAMCGTELYSPIISEEAMNGGFTNAGGYGGTVTFFKSVSGLKILQDCRRFYNRKGENFTFNDLEAFARSAPHFKAKIDLTDPFFDGNGDIPLKINEYCEHIGAPRPRTVAQTLRTIYESLAAEYAEALAETERLTGKTYPAIHILGGGSKDTLMCQMIADACNRPVVAGPAEAAALGNTASALIALGEIACLKDARSIIRRNMSVKEYYPENPDEWSVFPRKADQ